MREDFLAREFKERLMQTLWLDVRYALRTLAKNFGFTAVAIVTLALGIGANTALFSIVNGVLLNPLPYEHAEQLVAVYAKTVEFKTSSITYPNFLDWQRDNHSFTALAAFRPDTFNLTGGDEAEHLHGNMVTATFFPVLGVQPVAGRIFSEQEDQLGGTPTALISEGLAKRKFGSAGAALGQSLSLNGKLYGVVGVIPASFRFENNNFDSKAEVYVPIGQWTEPLFRDRSASMGMDAVGRLKPEVTLQQADADMSSVAAHLAETYPEVDKNSGVTLISSKENLVGDIRPFLLVLLGAVGFVLLISCVNVANLLLARATGRTREFAIRTALGANRARIARQLLTESVLLALAGGAFGMLFASWGTSAAIKTLPDALPRAEEIHLDVRVLLFTLAVSLLSGLLFGLAPALKTSQVEISETLKEGGRGGSGSRHRTQSVFVAMEMALAVVLLAAAGLMIRSLTNLWTVDPGFDAQNVMRFSFATSQPLGTTPAAIRAAVRNLQTTIASVPGVQAASMSDGASPLEGDSEVPFWLDGEAKPAAESEMKDTLFYLTQADYLKVMKIPLKRGRFLTEADNEKAPKVMVIDEQFAKLYFKGQDPIGRRVNLDILNETAEVVGIVGHVKQWGLDSDARASIQAQSYLPMAQLPESLYSIFQNGARVVVRLDAAPVATMDAIRHALTGVNSQMVIFGTQRMSDVISDSLATTRFVMILLGVFASLALLLASIGIYGVISYVVGERTREIGIRMAMGAEARNVLLMVLGQAGKMVMLGVAAGVLCALALTRLMSSMLFGVSPTDPLTLAGVAIVLTLVSLLACWIPARRATRVDPLVALRYE
jgi:predicted permease